MSEDNKKSWFSFEVNIPVLLGFVVALWKMQKKRRHCYPNMKSC